jgi:predicted lipid-binding transport protein (Tim44 family)
MSAIDAWDSMGLAARVILLILAVFAFLLVFIVIDRFVAYRRAERPAGPPPLRGALQRRMHTLAAIKVTGPMLGLLGTLLGLINAFAGMAMTGSVDARALGAGVSEALIMTALGLVIGLPAWWAHSFFAAWAERIAARAEAASPSS